ncbi:CDP-alcohol phosphatidyltransferase family protein [Flavobacterium sp.]|uniref:CDP-alcohol phosphatidyltransferase family protein n=1 Tax=Flavobacterium sp. TaxID=239 RepID=UPI002633F984|nr:CDP-alcohol phosphatidyltransferase family protein [Flavobacterium sp.]MDD3005314.1 CDP-alcohol phosphatidyltransferase family protein [Flavobacterium sp.]
MPKLNKEDQFIDFSDYARGFGNFLAENLKHSRVTPIHLTLMFGVCGILAIVCMLNEYYISAGILILLKSGIDAADGELARLKNTPSYSGRYLDSIFDFVLNFFFLATIAWVTNASILIFCIAFFSIQLQGTLYNYYYVILRNKSIGGDATSKIFETQIPKALLGESQKVVNVLFKIYFLFYGIFDQIIYFLDSEAAKNKRFPNWFMSMISIYGLGFQLLIIAIMLALNQVSSILYVLIFMNLPFFVFILLRKIL